MGVEVACALVQAVNDRDTDAFVACLSPDVEWEENGDVPGARAVYRGREAVRGWFEEVLAEPWEHFHIEVEEISEASDGAIFSELLITARGRGSGAETELRFWTASWLADGLIARRRVFWTRDEALAAAGLRALDHSPAARGVGSERQI
jgi:ketosteroid isomerase-like protein